VRGGCRSAGSCAHDRTCSQVCHRARLRAAGCWPTPDGSTWPPQQNSDAPDRESGDPDRLLEIAGESRSRKRPHSSPGRRIAATVRARPGSAPSAGPATIARGRIRDVKCQGAGRVHRITSGRLVRSARANPPAPVFDDLECCHENPAMRSKSRASFRLSGCVDDQDDAGCQSAYSSVGERYGPHPQATASKRARSDG